MGGEAEVLAADAADGTGCGPAAEESRCKARHGHRFQEAPLVAWRRRDRGSHGEGVWIDAGCSGTTTCFGHGLPWS